jgi:hypothetical protein
MEREGQMEKYHLKSLEDVSARMDLERGHWDENNNFLKATQLICVNSC